MLPEIESYLAMIEDLRGQVSALIADLPADALNWRPLPGIDAGEGGHSTNSLAVLAAHIAGAERFWIAEVVGGLPRTRDRDAEFQTSAGQATDLVALLERAGSETRQVLSTLTETDIPGARQARGRTIPVRWCILHAIDHTALHLGHMQLTLQLWQGGQSGPSPRWFERIRKS
jgi:uncharacterized damage-inducible protein DinB